MSDIPELIGGPYPPPAVKRGDWIEDAIDGLTEVGGWTDAPISWPRRKKTGRPSLILTPELALAVCTESVAAICHYWGVGPTKVWQWRQAIGVGRITDGTRQLLKQHTGVPAEAAARGREQARSAESRGKMAETKRGKPAHENTKAALLEAAKRPKPPGWGARANAWMAGKPEPDQCVDLTSRRRRWTQREDDYIRRSYGVIASDTIASNLRRSPASIRARANKLGVRKSMEWTPDDDDFLVSEYPYQSARWIADQLGRSEEAIHIRAGRLQIASSMFRWDPDIHDDILIEAHATGKSMAAAAREIGTSTTTVSNNAKRLGLDFSSRARPQRNSS